MITNLDHPIFIKSIAYIRSQLLPNDLDELQRAVLERLIHSSGDFEVQKFLRFSPEACNIGLKALKLGAAILTDTCMASSALAPMAKRTLQAPVKSILDWAPINQESLDLTRTALGMKRAWAEFSHDSIAPIVVIGSSPTALQALLELVSSGSKKPSLIVGMPVGFIGVSESKDRLLNSNCSYILLEGSRGGAALAAATINALLRAAVIE